ncbi:cytochrome P450 [Micromonospora sp. B11E3]|uniref:cytochrome P450 family protein n=1 Tax=Micromonospora sp. B11E3 TaxID=3153562 RepID=UPI00325D5A85
MTDHTSNKLVLGEELISPLHPLYDGLRIEGPARPAYRSPDHPVWVVTKYQDARTVLASPHVRRSPGEAGRLFARTMGYERPAIGGALLGHMLNADPPDHTRLRALIAKAFTMRRVERLRPVVERITDQLLDQIADQDQVDLMAAFCFPLPLMIIFELIGVPAEDREKFREWGERQGTPLTWAEAEELTGELTAYLEQLIAHKRAHPADDLLTGLIQARDNDDKLSDPELVGMTYLMIMAGFETTMNLLGNGLLTLLRHPDQLAEVRANPELLPQALEAYLRYDGPVVACMLRFTTGPVELRDVTIPADSFVLVNLTLANRDPERYADPDTFDIHRQIEGHLAFGHGVHYCIGAPLARMEGQVGIARLLERFPHLCLAVPPEDLRWLDTTFLRALTSLPVHLKGA